ncbi:MAG TPA: PIG-L family deacetylase [Mycobacterium sp.]|nr:PIG-L family deacetylase [Mycobacterium sp.]
MTGAKVWCSVVISPHFDDAALSVGGFVRRLTGGTAVVTVHGGPPGGEQPISEWDARCGFTTAQEAYRVRLAEDARGCALLGVDQVALPHADGPYRRGEPLDALKAFLDQLDSGTEVYLPLGTNQPDHATVRDQALRALAGRAGPPTKVYADLPYTAIAPGWGTDAADSLLATAPSGLAYRTLRDQYALMLAEHVRLNADEWSHKRDAILCYSSQIGPIAGMSESCEMGALLRYPGPLQFELIWRLESGATAAD